MAPANKFIQKIHILFQFWYNGEMAAIVAFLIGVFGISLYAVEKGDLIDELVSAIKSQDHEKVKQVSEKLKKMGDEAMPLIEKGTLLLKERGFDVENSALAGHMMQVLKNIKTKASTKMLLDLTGQWKDTPEGEYHIVGGAMHELSNRDIDIEIDKGLLDFMLRKLQEGKLFTAPQAARILGKMKKVDPKVRAEAIIASLKKEASRESDANTPQKPLQDAYVTEPQHKIRQYIFALEDVGAPAIPFISRELNADSNSNYKEYLTICLCMAGGKKTPSPEIKSEIIRIAKNSSNGEIRTLVIQILGEWEDKTLIPLFKDALNDNYKVAVKTDLITPDTYKGIDGYYFDRYPVRSKAFSALLKLGVKVENKGKGIYKVVE